MKNSSVGSHLGPQLLLLLCKQLAAISKIKPIKSHYLTHGPLQSVKSVYRKAEFVFKYLSMHLN
jgi:hypothetical protein